MNSEEKTKGYLILNDIEYVFTLENNKLFLILKEKQNYELRYKDKIPLDKRKWLINPKHVVDKWIKAIDFTTIGTYYFHCIGYRWESENLQVLLIDYYAEVYEKNMPEDFLQIKADGLTVSADVIGEYIKDTIEIKEETTSALNLSLKTHINNLNIEGNNIDFVFRYDFNRNPHYYGLECLAPELLVLSKDRSIDELFEIFKNIKELFSFISRKRSINIPEFDILKKVLGKDCEAEPSYIPRITIHSTNIEKDNEIGKGIVSSKFSQYFCKVYELIANKKINCYHLPNSNKFEVAQLIMMYSWFEKIFKTVPLNSKINTVLNHRGKTQLYWIEKTKNGKSKPVTEKQQLDIVLEDNIEVKSMSFEFLMNYGGFKESSEFLGGWSKRIADFRNDIIHNEDIYGYDFILQDTLFLELVNYYLIFKYKCGCSEEETKDIINELFFIPSIV